MLAYSFDPATDSITAMKPSEETRTTLIAGKCYVLLNGSSLSVRGTSKVGLAKALDTLFNKSQIVDSEQNIMITVVVINPSLHPILTIKAMSLGTAVFSLIKDKPFEIKNMSKPLQGLLHDKHKIISGMVKEKERVRHPSKRFPKKDKANV